MRLIRLSLALLLVAPVCVRAQKAMCGPDTALAHNLEFLAEVFEDTADDGNVEFRADHGIVRQSPGGVREVVTNKRDCKRLIAAIRAHLQRGLKGRKAKGQVTWMTFAFYRIGDYFVASEEYPPDPNPTVIVNGYSDTFIFRVSDLKLVVRYLG